MEKLSFNILPPSFKVLTLSPQEILAREPELADHVAVQLIRLAPPSARKSIWQRKPVLDTGLYILRSVFSTPIKGRKTIHVQQIARHLNYFFADIIQAPVDPIDPAAGDMFGVSDAAVGNRLRAYTLAGVEFADLSHYQNIPTREQRQVRSEPVSGQDLHP